MCNDYLKKFQGEHENTLSFLGETFCLFDLIIHVMLVVTFIALLVSSMFPHLNKDRDFTGARNRDGVLFFVSAATGFIAA